MEIWYTDTMEYCSALTNVIAKYSEKWMDLACILLIEVAQSYKKNYVVFPHMWDIANNRWLCVDKCTQVYSKA